MTPPKTARRNRQYAVRSAAFLRANPWCQIRWDDRCTSRSTETHHSSSRGTRPDLVLDETLWIAGCAHCHRMVTDNPKLALERGFRVLSTDTPTSDKIGLLTDKIGASDGA